MKIWFFSQEYSGNVAHKIEYTDIGECMFQWFNECRGNSQFTGPNHEWKAQMFAESLGHKEFTVSNGWLNEIKNENEITFYRASCESANV